MGLPPQIFRDFSRASSKLRGLYARCCSAERCGVLAFDLDLLAAASGLTILLDRRTRHGGVRAKHAAVASQGLQPGATALAVIEDLAGVGRHRFNGLVLADRTSQCRLKLHRAS